MVVELNQYINERIKELTACKLETLKLLKDTAKTGDEINLDEEKDLLNKKMQYYIATGALAELEELKKVLNG
ncbi:hypothetical protein PJ311_10975 [Bacillus sp. CLL-7-23]|uniref:Uncharacterized protein n=1 Tax=Bacillus changyiensis TaxID=3004103 RepID=A0ABT4X4P0_9BACI|nr:hypothetical protein [Bacillus changyiensis]MDA7027130.1 hypothetical protein [Bacillus changyiensis]